MNLVVDVIDSQCSLRRRHLATRAERHLLRHIVDATCWTVRDFEGVPEWLTRRADGGGHGVRVVFLHASEFEPNWEAVVRALAEHVEEPQPPALRLVTFGGGDPPIASFRLECGPHHKIVEPGGTAWWQHVARVFSRRDHRGSPAQAAVVGLETERPPVERVLDEVRTSFLQMKPTDRTERNPEKHDTPGRTGGAPNGGGRRHTLVNAVGPLRNAISFAQAMGIGISDLPKLWTHLRKCIAEEAAVDPWVDALLTECEVKVLPRITGEAGAPAPALYELTRALVQIEAYAAALDRADPPWRLLEALEAVQGPPFRVLWLDDEEAWYDALRPAFAKVGIEPTYVTSVDSLPDPEVLVGFDAVVVDLVLEGQGDATRQLLERHGIISEEDIGDSTAGLGVVQVIQSLPVPPPVFVLSARESPAIVRACTVLGARDYFVKGRGDDVHLLVELRRGAAAARENRTRPIQPANPALVVGDADDPLRETLLNIDLIATSGSRGPVMFIGEPGVGKEELAREVHLRSRRRAQAFVVIDCSRLNNEMIESELFGHVKGAFTGTTRNRPGLFEQAHGGVAFIDELDKLDVGLQSRLLRVVEAGETRSVGDEKIKKVDVLLVFASNVDPRTKAGRDAFSPPLIGRVSTFLLPIPTLRERALIVPTLASALSFRISQELGLDPRRLLTDALKWLQDLARAGRFDGAEANVRGLRSLVERTIVYSRGVTELGVRQFKLAEQHRTVASRPGTAAGLREAAQVVADDIEEAGRAVLQNVKDEFEAALLRELIVRTDRQRVASLLGTNTSNLRQSISKLRKKGLWPWDF